MDEEEVISVPFDEEDIDDSAFTYRTYRMDLQKKRIVGMVDGREAAAQSAVKALQTKRFAYQIYDDQYGCDISNKIGNADLTDEYLDTDIPVMIDDCLIVDDMISGVDEINYEMYGRDSVIVNVYLKTIFGNVGVEGVVVNE